MPQVPSTRMCCFLQVTENKKVGPHSIVHSPGLRVERLGWLAGLLFHQEGISQAGMAVSLKKLKSCFPPVPELPHVSIPGTELERSWHTSRSQGKGGFLALHLHMEKKLSFMVQNLSRSVSFSQVSVISIYVTSHLLHHLNTICGDAQFLYV